MSLHIDRSITMINATFTSPFDAPPAGGLIAVELDPRRQVAHRAIAGYLAGYSGATPDAYRFAQYKALTTYDLKLNMNADVRAGNRGACFGDSGGPVLAHDTDLAVALISGGDPNCRSNSINARLDTLDAREFLGMFVVLP
jgi:hypothetical protein